VKTTAENEKHCRQIELDLKLKCQRHLRLRFFLISNSSNAVSHFSSQASPPLTPNISL
jgi:hypothetical protein